MKNTKKTTIIGTKLRNHFESHGYSQADLAKILSTKQSWISRIYSGEFTERSIVAIKMCKMAGINPEWGSFEVKSDDLEAIRIAYKIIELKKLDRQAISKICRLLEDL